jgi:hypothetical protein
LANQTHSRTETPHHDLMPQSIYCTNQPGNKASMNRKRPSCTDLICAGSMLLQRWHKYEMAEAQGTSKAPPNIAEATMTH